MQGKIVSTVYYEGTVLIFTEHGYIYQMSKDSSGQFVFQLIHRLREE